MKQFIAVVVGITLGTIALAQSSPSESSHGMRVTVRDVTHEYLIGLPEALSTPTPAPTTLPGTKGGEPPVINPTLPSPITPEPLPPFPGGGGTNGNQTNTQRPAGRITLSDMITIGQKVWDFVVSNKPNATYQPLKAAVVPSGITSWTQLRGWSKPVSKVYRVEFMNIFGRSAGSFDYRINFVYGGSYRGKGKYIGQISFVPAGVRLGTDRTLDVKAELLDPLNFGTEEDPVAGVELQITWSSPTTTRYQLNSVEFFLYGTGEIQEMTHGN